MMSPNSETRSSRPIVRTPISDVPRTIRPPGVSTFSLRNARSTSCALKLYAFILSMSRKTLICRVCPPEMSIEPTPSIVSNARRICLSAISVNSRGVRFPLTASVTIGSLSGSDLVTVGGKTFGGSFRIAAETFSRTSSTASPMSRSKTNVIVKYALPSVIIARISSMPLTDATVSSSGSTTWETTSSGLAPGSRTRTFTVAGSVFGNKSTPKSIKLKIPSITRNMISMKANTGRRTQISERLTVAPNYTRRLANSNVHHVTLMGSWQKQRFFSRAKAPNMPEWARALLNSTHPHKRSSPRPMPPSISPSANSALKDRTKN